MLGLFSAVKNTVPIGKKIGWAKTEGPISVLHYRATTLLFLCCCVLVTSLEWIGNGANITCAMSGPSDDWNIPVGVINSYCYIQSTFTIPGPHAGSTLLYTEYIHYTWTTCR
ncbi:innexin inx3 [Eurytemora carolleeae]|uniref:innexin inx3 n=1 Tax=Eurytemora carolleeae TaxID=1294199 RepID=UPI000C7759F0|nr:innexin inx3 [Eurytemora carolleeae]XP_023338655.1 innexin inx3 [Eurytemora carolleeae]|eukprot:XP_023338654.1 innexin inx3-like [Eurytemora affinis]